MRSKTTSTLIIALFLGAFLFTSCAGNQKGMKVKSTNKMYKSRDFK